MGLAQILIFPHHLPNIDAYFTKNGQ
jgi:hypothetical protein